MGLSVPVAFQYPDVAARFGRAPFGYLRSRGLKKYHSCSPKVAFADNQTMASSQPVRSGYRLRKNENSRFQIKVNKERDQYHMHATIG
jgi:hypothetical protein